MHPHVHGSSTLQVGGGAALALIVRDVDPNATLPAALAAAVDVLWLIQHHSTVELASVASASGDGSFAVGVGSVDLAAQQGAEGGGEEALDPSDSDFFLINGQLRPVLAVQAGEWQQVHDLLFLMRGEGVTTVDTLSGYHKNLWKRAKVELARKT